ncbi:GNAT family N-acetyltransferase [Rathayibacter sp. CAU 1779]
MIHVEFDGPLQSERLTLRMMTMRDVDAIYAHESRDDVCRYLLYEPRTRDEVAEKIADWSTRTRLAEEKDFLQLAVEERESRRVLGEIYFAVTSTEHQTTEIGWVFHPDNQGHGYATEAAETMLGFAFGTVEAHRVIAELTPENTASVAVCRRLGMREEAHFVQDMLVKGNWEDTGVYAMLRSEWTDRLLHP